MFKKQQRINFLQSNLSLGKSIYSAGITLIELLVVVAILGVLSAVLFGVIDPIAQIERGRDGRRIDDMKAMQNAFEQWYTVTGGGMYDTTQTNCTGMVDHFSSQSLPTDPAGTYTCVNDQSAYCACAELKNSAMLSRFANSSSGALGTTCAFVPQGDPSATHFCVQSLQ